MLIVLITKNTLSAISALGNMMRISAQNDSGMFKLNFRDERYLPFDRRTPLCGVTHLPALCAASRGAKRQRVSLHRGALRPAGPYKPPTRWLLLIPRS